MRHEKAEVVLRLAIELKASTMGLSLDEMGQRLQENFGTKYGRRTVERLRDAVGRLYSDMEVANPGEYPKRWRIPGNAFALALQPSQEELAGLDLAVKFLRRQQLKNEADQLARLGAKIRSALPASTARKLELDLQPLLEAEGVALRPGPKLNVSTEWVATIRQAIQLSMRIRINYRKRDGNATGTYVLEPYGFLYGNTRPYLIGYVPARRGIRHFSLSDITSLELIPETFVPDSDFSLAKFAERSFGVFQETDGPFDVVWKFTPYGARDARQFQFHPSQTVEEHKDGSITVRFRACGLKEMVWHLLTWDEHVEIISPPELQIAYSDLVNRISSGAVKKASKNGKKARDMVEVKKS